ncbi:MAG: ABC transporter permease [Vulcanisaeta sp.]|jgi:ABC-2 type transport system permease protein|uniref:ABC transporter permease n=1 Tax=Vulcanisaeta sp. TaxID=2020871 RepID=UPI003D10A066
MGVIDRLYGFVVIRGWKMWISYKTQVALTMINWVIPVFIYFFIGITLGFGKLSAIKNYTAFMVIGTAFQGYFSASVTTLAGRIRNEELIGTLEYLIASPLRPMALMMYNTVWGLIINSISALLVLLIGLGLGITYRANLLSSIVFLILYLASIIGLNLIAGAVVLIVKQGNPIALFTSVASNLLGGVVFPISVLPTWLQYISYSLSLTWALSGLRGAMLYGYSIPKLLNYLWPLAVLAVIYIVIGVALSSYAFMKILKEGSVHMY